MESQETYAALYCARKAGFDGWDFVSFHVDAEAANAAITTSEAEMPIGHAANVQWRIEVRNAHEIRVLVAALDARNPNIDPLLRLMAEHGS